MIEIFSWLFWGLCAVVLTAAVVAGWEHLARQTVQRQRRAEQALQPAGVLGTHRVDLRLDTQSAGLASELPADSLSAGDGAATERQSRLAAVADALARAARPGLPPRERGHWMDTAPRVVDLKEPALGAREPAEQGSTSEATERGTDTPR